MNRKSLLIHGALLFVSAVFGANSVTAKIALQEITPFALVTLRVVSAAVILFVLHRLFVREKIKSTTDFFRLAMYSVFGIIINQILFLKGLSMTTPINATILVTTIPVVTILVAMLMGREKPSTRKLSGALISFAGVITLIGWGGIDFKDTYFVGNLLVFINAVSFSIFLVLSKPILARYSPSTVTTWIFVFGSLGVLPVGWKELQNTDWVSISAIAWACVAFLILFSSVIVYYINNWALQRTQSSTVAAYIYIQPLVASAFSTYALEEPITARKIIASLLIFGGVILVSIRRKNAKPVDMDFVKESLILKED